MKRIFNSMGTATILMGLFAGNAAGNEDKSSNSADIPPDEELAVISTEHGDMIVQFWPDVAPKTVENFKKLAKDGYYDGTAFHRVIRGFMIQGGCPNTREGETGTPGTGNPGYFIDAEFNERPHERGVLSMARSADPNSAGSQFFVVHQRAPHLDRQYTGFGKLVKGDDVLEAIATTRVSGPQGSTPTERQEVTKVRIVPASKALGDSKGADKEKKADDSDKS